MMLTVHADPVDCLYDGEFILIPHGLRGAEDDATVKYVRSLPHDVARVRLVAARGKVFVHVTGCPEKQQRHFKRKLLEVLGSSALGASSQYKPVIEFAASG
ncbi:hypothetical protein AB0N09_33260 [Streptomyces erythrochromogenes]|uniref:hypothetical protein n=1 Tax=Streptomyces erythrochromogenes TaxID=285574 RepID=UPI003448D144